MRVMSKNISLKGLKQLKLIFQDEDQKIIAFEWFGNPCFERIFWETMINHWVTRER